MPSLSPKTVRIMAAAGGLAVANLYYNQPLLGEFQKYFGSAAAEIGWIPTATQLGYATGMLILVPLGDQIERRSLVVTMLFLSSLTLLLCAFAPSLTWLVASSFLVGLTSVAPQLLLPFAAHLASPSERGKVLGTVMSGLLIGILLARTASGFIGASFGWRAMFVSASVVMVALALVLRRALPESAPTFAGSYFALLRSIGKLVTALPSLRQSAFIGAMLFGSFSAFWATLSFLISEPPFYLGPRAAGMFGLLGAAGALAAPWVGRIVDSKNNPRAAVALGVGVTALGFGFFWVFSHSLIGLILGVLLLDIGVQGGHVANQSIVFSLVPEARSRLNTVYMFSYFVGGAAGSALASWGFSRAGWNAVCLVGLGLLGAGAVSLFILNVSRINSPQRAL